mmetsp:Transcript_18652/g.33679  ORF Transcript_18652/g.33679 Transcript_18652/m.33679 type:complete len:192 (-) Transcript_18652:67-642(-)
MAKASLLTAAIASAVVTFVVTRASPAAFALPGQKGATSHAKTHDIAESPVYVPFESKAAAQENGVNVASIVSVAATFGLVFGLLAAPVRAEDEEVSTRAARKARRAAALQAEKSKEKAESSSSTSSGFALPSLPNPFEGISVSAPSAAPKVVMADEDRSPVASDPVALFLIFFTVPTIYLSFYVLGSVDVI